MKIIKIIKPFTSKFWYTRKIGETYKVVRENKYYYYVFEENYLEKPRFVFKNHCEIINDDYKKFEHIEENCKYVFNGEHSVIKIENDKQHIH